MSNNFEDININTFSLFNKQLYDESNEEFYDEFNSICNTFEEEESNNTESTSNETCNSIEDEEKLIPLHLLQSINKDQSVIKIDDTKNNIIYPNEESKSRKEENIEFITYNENNKKEEEISNIKSTEKDGKESSTTLPPNVIDKLDISSEPFIPKKYSNSKMSKIQNNNHHHIYFYNDDKNNYPFNKREKKYFNKDKNKKNKKKKKEFIQRENDWICYRCRNINFSYRVKCNKCHLEKEESEKKYNEVGEKLLKLVNNSEK